MSLNKSGGDESVRLHSVVVFSVLDQYMRRQEGRKRVIGTLLGHRVDGVVEVTNCYAVPHEETSKSYKVEFGKEYNKEMYKLHRQINHGEEIVGWYSTASEEDEPITKQTCVLQDFYRAEMRAHRLTHRPILVIVDTALTDNSLSVKAFVNPPLQSGISTNNSKCYRFKQIECKYQHTREEEIGLNAIVKSTSQGVNGFLDHAPLKTEMQNLESAIGNLLSMLQSTSSFVDDVIEGKRPMDNVLGLQIARTLSALPKFDASEFDSMFNNSIQDLLMVSQLSSLTRLQIMIAERLSSTR